MPPLKNSPIKTGKSMLFFYIWNATFSVMLINSQIYMTTPKQAPNKLSENIGKTFSVIMPLFHPGWGHNYGNYCTLHISIHHFVLCSIITKHYFTLFQCIAEQGSAEAGPLSSDQLAAPQRAITARVSERQLSSSSSSSSLSGLCEVELLNREEAKDVNLRYLSGNLGMCKSVPTVPALFTWESRVARYKPSDTCYIHLYFSASRLSICKILYWIVAVYFSLNIYRKVDKHRCGQVDINGANWKWGAPVCKSRHFINTLNVCVWCARPTFYIHLFHVYVLRWHYKTRCVRWSIDD